MRISLIQAFFGTSRSHADATTEALHVLLSHKLEGVQHVFVECQLDEADAKFKWLQDHDVQYVFRKMTPASIGLMLKMPLWNIGVSFVNHDKFVFLDSDVHLEPGNWPLFVEQALSSYDVIQPAGWWRSSSSTMKAGTLAYSLMKSGWTHYNHARFFNAHPGLCLGMTKAAYRKIGKFDAVNQLDDQWFWAKVLGVSNIPDGTLMPSYRVPSSMLHGIDVKVGSIDEVVCVHHEHRCGSAEMYKKVMHMSMNVNDAPFEDVDYTNEIPTWASNEAGRKMQQFMKSLKSISTS